MEIGEHAALDMADPSGVLRKAARGVAKAAGGKSWTSGRSPSGIAAIPRCNSLVISSDDLGACVGSRSCKQSASMLPDA